MTFILLTWIVVLSYIWFETEAIQEYVNLFGGAFHFTFPKYEEYRAYKNINPSISYHNFLILRYRSFFVSLITCPTCLTVWLNAIGFIILQLPLILLSVNIIGTWLVYYFLVWSIKKFNE